MATRLSALPAGGVSVALEPLLYPAAEHALYTSGLLVTPPAAQQQARNAGTTGKRETALSRMLDVMNAHADGQCRLLLADELPGGAGSNTSATGGRSSSGSSTYRAYLGVGFHAGLLGLYRGGPATATASSASTASVRATHQLHFAEHLRSASCAGTDVPLACKLYVDLSW